MGYICYFKLTPIMFKLSKWQNHLVYRAKCRQKSIPNGPSYWTGLSVSINVNALPSAHIEVLSLDELGCCNSKQFLQASTTLVKSWICLDFLYFLYSQGHSSWDAHRKLAITEKYFKKCHLKQMPWLRKNNFYSFFSMCDLQLLKLSVLSKP